MSQKRLDLLNNPRTNKSTAFTLEEREEYGLTGILPPYVSTMEQQVERSLQHLRHYELNIHKYLYLASLQKRNERLYYRLLIDHTEELMPIVYTPTVGQACQEFAKNFHDASGFYISTRDKGNIEHVLENWQDDVELIVVTDGERILGLGDLGANGMAIPIGKLALYCACAGVDPSKCLPILLDVGTKNEELRNDPMYLGLRQERITGDDYFAIIDEFVNAVKNRYPNALLQFEDFSTPNAVKLLDIYRDQLLCFNDDIQGTASVALAGLMAATRLTNTRLSDMRFLFMGAGSAATGIGDIVSKAMQREGLTEAEANARLAFIDSKGLITTSRETLTEHARPFASSMPPMSFEETLDAFKPNALIGATGRPGMFTQAVIEKMAEFNEQPIIFALSNPTANAECTAEDTYHWTQGRAIFASGSPFGIVHVDGKMKVPGQGNNAYIFPGLGLGALHSGATKITDDMLIAAAHALAETVSQDQIDHGCLYPPLQEIREVSVKIAIAVANIAEEKGLTKAPLPADFEETLRAALYNPYY